MSGLFVVFEGIDGAGAETQSRILVDRLKRAGKDVLFLDYPDYSGPIGALIRNILEGKQEIGVRAFTLLFIADFLKDRDRILSALGSGGIVVANRYFTSTLNYEAAYGLEKDRLIAVARAMDLPVPDLVVYLDITPEESSRRKLAEKGSRDRHETDLAFLSRVRAEYLDSVRRNLWARWVRIDGMKGIEDVAEDVRDAVRAVTDF